MSFYGKSEQWWKALLTGDNPVLPFRRLRGLFSVLPSNPRCKFCHAPFEGAGAPLMRLIGKRPSRLTPQLCRQCEAFARNIPGGAEIELTMLFADVRGSTTLAEGMNPFEYSQLINRFYVTATKVLNHKRSWVDRLVGDQVVGLFVPGFAGEEHARLGIQAAQELLEAMDYGGEGEPWLPVGVGVHTDVAFVGAVGTENGATDITVLGDAANTAARLSSNAASGEIVVSEAACRAAGLDHTGLELREMALKGKSQPIEVHVLRSSR